jgi:hypothetical protein
MLRFFLAAFIVLIGLRCFARDIGQWGAVDPDIKRWFQNLKMPDSPSMPCCGEADAYWADSYEIDGDKYIAIITDDRPDGPLGRAHRKMGERIVIPNNKIKWDQGNPTGHGIVFLGSVNNVYCYLPPGGV